MMVAVAEALGDHHHWVRTGRPADRDLHSRSHRDVQDAAPVHLNHVLVHPPLSQIRTGAVALITAWAPPTPVGGKRDLVRHRRHGQLRGEAGEELPMRPEAATPVVGRAV